MNKKTITVNGVEITPTEYLHQNYDVDAIIEDFGVNGWDYYTGSDLDEIEERLSDYKLEEGK